MKLILKQILTLFFAKNFSFFFSSFMSDKPKIYRLGNLLLSGSSYQFQIAKYLNEHPNDIQNFIKFVSQHSNPDLSLLLYKLATIETSVNAIFLQFLQTYAIFLPLDTLPDLIVYFPAILNLCKKSIFICG